MDLVFNCPNCEQELVVDSTAAGNEITCPTCKENIVIPEPPPPTAAAVPGQPALEVHPINPIDSSAARKEEKHLKVPVHEGPTESLITKALPPLEVAAKETDRKIRIKTIRHTDCIEVGHDRFDEIVSQFLGKIGEQHIVSINSINYTFLDIGTQKLMTEYGVMVVYRG